MNAAASSIGMRESHFVNPNGLPDSRQVSSARDMALLGRALYLQFPDRADLFDIGGFRLGSRISRNHNPLLGRYPGADGMKTGFTCSAGFNIVASATHGNRRLIVVVLGAPSSGVRTAMATALFDRGFMATSSMGSISSLNGFVSSEPPDMHDQACYRRGRAAREYLAQVQRVTLPGTSNAAQQAAVLPERDTLIQGAKKKGKAMMVAAADTARAVFEPIAVYIGRAPGWSGPVAQARPANTPVGTPSPVTAYAPEAKPTMLDGSAPPIAASAADALPMRRVAEPVAKPAKVLATRSDAVPVTAAPDTKAAAKPVRTAKVRHRVRIAHAKPLPAPTEYTRSLSLNEGDKPMPGRHKKIAAARPASEEGDGGAAAKTVVKAKPARAKAKREKPAEAE
jgi:D-alanyl-D-alanine carboxypeptidase